MIKKNIWQDLNEIISHDTPFHDSDNSCCNFTEM